MRICYSSGVIVHDATCQIALIAPRSGEKKKNQCLLPLLNCAPLLTRLFLTEHNANSIKQLITQ